MDKGVHQKITTVYSTLTSSQKRLADFILNCPYEAALMSASKLAVHLKVSEATVVRFAQAVGFDGYPDLRENLQEQLLREVRSSERVALMVENTPERTGALYEIVSETIYYLQLLIKNVSEEDIDEAVQRLDSKNRIFIYGEGAPGSLTFHADFWLSRLGYEVKRITQTGRRLFDHIFLVSERDIALVFAFRRVTMETLAVLEVFAESGGETILVTDMACSKIHPLASQILLVQRGPMDAFRPLGPLVALVDALILGLMRQKGLDAVEQLKRLDDLRERYGVLYDK